MGILNSIFQGSASVQQLPSGSITVDHRGEIVTSTVSSAYPHKLLAGIAGDVLALFRSAQAAQLALGQFSLQFGSLHVTARELRGGAIIFLMPQKTLSKTSPHPLP